MIRIMPDYEISKVLAALLVERGDYSFIDKLGYSPSSDLAVSYLKEALRDLHSLKSSDKIEKTTELVNDIDWDRVDREISQVARAKDRRALREIVSVITAQALALSAKIIGR